MSEPGSGPGPAGPAGPEGDPTRASDAEREAVVGRLNDAVGEGRLSLEELSQRVGQAYAARTRGELDKLVSDLPMPGVGLDVPPPARVSGRAGGLPSAMPDRVQWNVAPIGGFVRRGRWLVRRRTVFVTLLGGVSLDLREAALAAPEVTITTVSLVGGVNVKVPAGVRVETAGVSLLGGRSVRLDEATGPGAPTLRLRTYSVIGGVSVRSTLRTGTDRP